MAVSKEDILDTIASMSVMEVVDLIEAMEDKFGVSAAAAVAAAPAADAGGAAVEEIDEFDIMMTSFGENKVSVHCASVWHLCSFGHANAVNLMVHHAIKLTTPSSDDRTTTSPM